MIPKSVHEIGRDDLQALIDGQVAESKTVEYKRKIPGRADSDMVPFLAAVSSFANTSGGDLLIGIEAVEGIPTALPGMKIVNLDQERLRLEQVVANGLEPRLPHIDFHMLEVGEGCYVLVVRVPRKSWVAPHRVRKNNKFYGRNSAGMYPLDVGELRTAFTLSETVTERIRSFRAERIALIYGDEAPVPMKDGAKMILHVVPLSAFTEASQIDIEAQQEQLRQLIPLGASGWSYRINLEGYVNLTDNRERSRAYTQIFRTGIVEAVSVVGGREGSKSIPNVAYERYILHGLNSYLTTLGKLGVEPPIYIFLSWCGVRGYRMGVNAFRFEDEGHPLDRDTLVLTELLLDRYDIDIGRMMRPVFNQVWNAFGFIRCFNYNDDGDWMERR